MWVPTVLMAELENDFQIMGGVTLSGGGWAAI